ncbi:hypothetical protein ACWC10_14905 [Streptomyces sp. NPDC001595]
MVEMVKWPLLTSLNDQLRTAEVERQKLTDLYTQVISVLSTELDCVTAERDELLGNVRSISRAPSRRPSN